MKEKIKARMLFKQLKAGMINANQLSEEELMLIKKYCFFKEKKAFAM